MVLVVRHSSDDTHLKTALSRGRICRVLLVFLELQRVRRAKRLLAVEPADFESKT